MIVSTVPSLRAPASFPQAEFDVSLLASRNTSAARRAVSRNPTGAAAMCAWWSQEWRHQKHPHQNGSEIALLSAQNLWNTGARLLDSNSQFIFASKASLHSTGAG